MWIEFEIVASENETIFLPENMGNNFNDSVFITFGDKTFQAEVQYSNELEIPEESTYEKPGKIKITSKIAEKLYFIDSLIYRVQIEEDKVFIGPVIGLLLGTHTHRYNPRHMKKYSDRFGIYNKIGGLVYAFSPKLINWKKKIAFGLYYNERNEVWEYGRFPLPEVVYRRDFHGSYKLVKRLIKCTDGRLFNSHRFSKLELYDYISKSDELRKYLPQTQMTMNFDQVKKFVDNFDRVILKPVDLSRGRGICIIEKINTTYKVIDYRLKNPTESIINDVGSLENFFNLNQGFFNGYLIQKYLSLARIDRSLFDIRVVMQKNEKKSWQCTGIECRVSGNDCHLTNISRGGYALTLEEALYRAFGSDYEGIPKKVDDFCQRFCCYMDEMGEHFSEFGIDVAVDTDRNIWLIEANVFPSFKGFKTMDRQTYLKIRYAPFIYALSLTRFGKEDNEEV